MKIAITGATGFVGTHLSALMREKGHLVLTLGRRDCALPKEELATRLAGCEAVFNLAGETISRRWTPAYKERILSSRLDTTRNLVTAMALMDSPPALFISTSAIGAFAQQGRYTEKDSANATDFLGQLSKDWEAAALDAETLGIRTLIFRFGLVLGRDGGLMKQLLPPFRLGLGGPVGDGSQAFSWIHIQDLVAAYAFALEQPAMQGIYHLCAPNPTTNKGFSQLLGQVLHRPAIFPVPVWLLRLLYGEGADVMASGQCLISERLPEAGFEFQYPELRSALNQILTRS
jgi:uncharacterized protein (TIGR01777 family)